MKDLTEQIRWPLMQQAAVGGMGLGVMYGAITGRFVFGIFLGLAAGVGFAIGRSFTS